MRNQVFNVQEYTCLAADLLAVAEIDSSFFIDVDANQRAPSLRKVLDINQFATSHIERNERDRVGSPI